MLRCVNWYGSHQQSFAPGGLGTASLCSIAARIVELGFNCVRIPYSLDLWYRDPAVPEMAVAANPLLLDKSGMQLTDVVIRGLISSGLGVMLNNHNSKADFCCSTWQEDGLWSTSEYPAAKWVEAIAGMSKRYRNYPLVFGHDIRNELRDDHSKGESNVRRATWGETNDIETDWRVAAHSGGNAVLQATGNSSLVIVGGMCYGFDLRPLHANPPLLARIDKLVVASHVYNFFMWWIVLEERGTVNWDGLRKGAIASLVVGVVLSGPLSAYIWSEGARVGWAVWASSISAWWLIITSALWVGLGYWQYGWFLSGCDYEFGKESQVRAAISAMFGLSSAALVISLLYMLWAKHQKEGKEDWVAKEGKDGKEGVFDSIRLRVGDRGSSGGQETKDIVGVSVAQARGGHHDIVAARVARDKEKDGSILGIIQAKKGSEWRRGSASSGGTQGTSDMGAGGEAGRFGRGVEHEQEDAGLTRRVRRTFSRHRGCLFVNLWILLIICIVAGASLIWLSVLITQNSIVKWTLDDRMSPGDAKWPIVVTEMGTNNGEEAPS
jgi:hypothetical protein